MKLSLLVIRTHDLLRVKEFYELLGLTFKEEKHGKGPKHFAAILDDGLVFEIYPIKDPEQNPDKVRLGFKIKYLYKLINKLRDNGVGPISQPIPNSYSILIKDPDGRTIELTDEGPDYDT